MAQAALRRLDHDIAEAERRLAQLRAMRENALQFVEQYFASTPVPAETTPPEQPSPARESLTDAVVQVFQNRPNEVLDVDDVLNEVRNNGVEATRPGVRNAIHYAVRLEKLRKDARRGRFAFKDTSTPVAAGVDVGEEPSDGSSGEIGGGREDGSTLLHDQDGGAIAAPIHLDRDGDRAPIGG
jgi:hypothetical protein